MEKWDFFFWQQKRGVNIKGWRLVEKEGTTVGIAYRLSAPWNIHHVNRGPNNIHTVPRQPHACNLALPSRVLFHRRCKVLSKALQENNESLV